VRSSVVDSQSLLEQYLSPHGSQEHAEELSYAIRGLVHRAVGKRETSDLDDFEEECLITIWAKISSLKYDTTAARIDNVEAFVRQAVHNRYCDAIRRKQPKWYNLKLELLDIFSGKTQITGFALWHSPTTQQRMCGFAEWNGSNKTMASACRQILDDPSRFRAGYLDNKDPAEAPSHELAAAMLTRCGGPVDIDTLTNTMIELTQSRAYAPLSIDFQPDDDPESESPVDWLVSTETDIETQIIDAAWFGHVMEWFWAEFSLLSVRQRKALLYGMPSDQAMALVAEVGLNEVAASVEMSDEQLASLINDLPLSDAATAHALAVQPRAVTSIRFKAWGRIRRRTKKSSLAAEGLEDDTR